MRRALVIAGSRTQIISLWEVDDENTRDLMVSYYGRLLAGAGRSAALRTVQLEMLKDGGDPSLGGLHSLGRLDPAGALNRQRRCRVTF